MTVIVIGDQQRTTYVTADSGHGHDAEDLQDIGELDVTNAEFNTVKITAGAQLTKDAALAFTPFDANGVQIPGAIYRFGRQSDFGDATQGLLDGIEMKHELLSEDQELSMQLHPSQPCLDINATKQANVDWVRITDSSDLRTILAIHDDGTIETPGWNSGSLPDGHHESLAVQPLSLYVGKCKLSEVNHQLHVEHLKVPPYIPLRLTQAPYSFTTGNINANTQRSVNDWVKLARSVLSATAGKALRIKDVFPVANSVDWNDSGVTHTHGLTSNAQTQLDALQPPVTQVVYVDASYSGSSTGSILSPYSSLSTALTAKLVDLSTTTYHFRLAPGVYTGTISIDHSFPGTQSFSIQGSGMNNTFIQGSAAWSGSTGNVLYFRDFVSIELKDVTVRHGAYGFYPRVADKVVMQRVRFKHCGSAGTVTRHNQSATQAEQAAYWASSDTSDGGAVRFRTIGEVSVHDCEVLYCARGLRLQDCGNDGTASIVSGCKVYRTLEAGIYCAASTYTGTDGCKNMLITGNQVTETANNGILLIGGKDITVQNNNIVRSANTGVMQWHSLDSRIISNSLFDCNRRSFNGVGNLADAYGQIVIDGNSNISSTTGSHMAVVQHNTMVKCNQGRAGAVYGINVQQSSGSGAYPTAKNKIVHDGNRSDAAVHFNNPNSIPTVNTHEAGVTTSELGHLSGVTSAIQTQVNAKQATLSTGQLAVANKTFSTVATNGTAICTATEIKSYADTKQGTLSAAQLTVTNKTFSTVATDGTALCTANEIKSYVDTEVAGAGGGSTGTSYVYFQHMTSFVQLADDVQFVHWSKSTGNNQGGGNGRFTLPAFASSPPATHTFWIMSHNPVDSGGGEIILEHVSGGQDFHNASDDQTDIEFDGNHCKLKAPDRNTYACTYYHSTQKWHIRRVTSHITESAVAQITSNTRFFKHFVNTESGYTSSSGNIFAVPSGNHEALLCYGDGTNYGFGSGGSNQALGVNVELPVANLIDGQKVILHSTMDYTSSNANQCLRLNFPGSVSGTPNTRRVCALGVEYLANASGGTRIVCSSSNQHTRNHTYMYFSAPDCWVLRVDTN